MYVLHVGSARYRVTDLVQEGTSTARIVGLMSGYIEESVEVLEIGEKRLEVRLEVHRECYFEQTKSKVERRGWGIKIIG